MKQLFIRSARPCLLAITSLAVSACAHQKITPAQVEPPPFKQTLKGYMAELGQYMDDVYRFWDSNSMHEVSLQRLDQMLEIHDRVLEIYPSYLKDHDVEEYRAQNALFEEYLHRSRKLTLELKNAVISKEDDKITEAFGNLDQNRRNAHSDFGRAF